jgi:hypothetical protein
LCGTVSKALEKSNSKMATSVCSPALYTFMKSWSVTNSWIAWSETVVQWC